MELRQCMQAGGIDRRHVAQPEDHHSGRTTVDRHGVAQLVGRECDGAPVGREDGAGQPIGARPVAEVEGLLETSVGIGVDGQDRAEQLLFEKPESRVGRLHNRRPHEPAHAVVGLAAGDDPRLFRGPREFNRRAVFLECTPIDDGAHEVAEVCHVALPDAVHLGCQLRLQRLPHRRRHVGTGSR